MKDAKLKEMQSMRKKMVLKDEFYIISEPELKQHSRLYMK